MFVFVSWHIPTDELRSLNESEKGLEDDNRVPAAYTAMASEGGRLMERMSTMFKP